MSEEYRAKLRSLGFSSPGRRPVTKVTTDVHDHHRVDVVEHWGDRQDVIVKPDPVRIRPRGVVYGA